MQGIFCLTKGQYIAARKTRKAAKPGKTVKCGFKTERPNNYPT